MNKDTVIELLKDSPLPAVAGLTLLGVSLQSWILILTAVWAAIRVAHAAFNFYWEWKDRKNGIKP